MIKKKDVVLVIAVLVLAGIVSIFFQFSQKEESEYVRIAIDGKEYGSYLIEENRIIEIRNAYGKNKIVIENHEVFMEYADCPDQYCVKHKAISKTNETIVCLPHKLVVELYGEKKEAEFDSMVQ